MIYFCFLSCLLSERGFIVSLESVFMFLCMNENFNTWNRREIFPWWRLGGSKSYRHRELFKKMWVQAAPYCLGLQKFFINTGQPFFLLLLLFLLLLNNIFLSNHIQYQWGGLFNGGLSFVEKRKKGYSFRQFHTHVDQLIKMSAYTLRNIH